MRMPILLCLVAVMAGQIALGQNAPATPSETGAKPPLPKADWIWIGDANAREDAPVGVRYFRKTFDLPEKIAGGWLRIAADDEYEAYLNGKQVASGQAPVKLSLVTVTDSLKTGRNTLAVLVRNVSGPAGLLASVHIMPEDGAELVFPTDATWKASDAEFPNWNQESFDDANWGSAVSLGAAPQTPWSSIDPFGSALTLSVSPEILTPNEDGLNDTLKIQFSYIYGYRGHVQIIIEDDARVSIAEFPFDNRTEGEVTWNATHTTGGLVAPGKYTIAAIAQSRRDETILERTVEIRRQDALIQGTNRFKETFPIGVWYDGRVEGINVPEGCTNVPASHEKATEYYMKTFRDIRRRGLEVVVIPNTPPDYRETLLSAADRVGIKIILELAEIAWPEYSGALSLRDPKIDPDETKVLGELKPLISPLRSHRSLFGYQLIDEPAPDLFEKWRVISRLIESIDPNRPSFSCLCREDAIPKAAEAGMKAIVFDRYPLARNAAPGQYDFKQYAALLDTIKANAKDIPFWNVIQAFESPLNHRFPTPEELRLMTYLSLSRNAKGIFFFLYNSKTQDERLGGLVDVDLNPAPLFDEVTKLAMELRVVRALLMRLAPVENTTTIEAPTVDGQMFTDELGNLYILVCNLNVLEPVNAVGYLRDTAAYIEDMVTQEKIPIDTAAQPKMTAELAAGAGRLFRITPQGGPKLPPEQIEVEQNQEQQAPPEPAAEEQAQPQSVPSDTGAPGGAMPQTGTPGSGS